MSRRAERRSTAAPMDFEFTSARLELPIDSPFRRGIEAATAEKRSRLDMEKTTTEPCSFGRPSNIPFLFNIPPPTPTTPKPFWSAPEIQDIQMSDPSPVKSDDGAHNATSRPISLGALKRVRKHRENQLARRSKCKTEAEYETDSSSSEDGSHPANKLTSHSTHYTLNMPGSGSSPSHLPYTLLGYTQVIFNSSLILLFLYLLITFILTVQRDVEQRIAQYAVDSMQEIALCTSSYTSNNCGNPLPALILQCLEWETCMIKDPSVVGHAKVGAEMLAEVINSFVEPISWKTLLFTLSSIGFFTVFVNAIINLYRSRHQPQTHSMNHSSAAHGRVIPPTWWPQPEPDEVPPRRRKLLNGNSVKIS